MIGLFSQVYTLNFKKFIKVVFSLFAEERHNEILNILNYEGNIVVKDLSNRFNVTEDCIRKDLNILESKALLRRTYGGAIPNRTAAHQESIKERKKLNLNLKSIIAECGTGIPKKLLFFIFHISQNFLTPVNI
ncbi:MAG: DeoR/GlpR transcriptional regulator [Clostridiaceae bacterium]|jgi:predicted transcriptional regulator|nr:DeoR/GlpR transcriptional regulator [Clostridiaceae bacterium]